MLAMSLRLCRLRRLYKSPFFFWLLSFDLYGFSFFNPDEFFHRDFFSVFPVPMALSFNSGNQRKTKDYTRIFKKQGLPVLSFHTDDLREIQGSHLDVVVHKASQFHGESVLVDDASLKVDGADVGVNVKWLILDLPRYIHKKAVYITYLAVYFQGFVYVFQGRLEGIIVSARGKAAKGAEFDPYFQPLNSPYTLAESFPENMNPRVLAAQNLLRWEVYEKKQPIIYWNGGWQSE